MNRLRIKVGVSWRHYNVDSCTMIMPTQLVASITSESNPFAVSITEVIGIPFYIRAEAVISLSATSAAKGLAGGAGYLYAFLF